MKNLFLSVLLSISLVGFAQKPDSASASGFDLGADLVSRYIWRGMKFSTAPAIQPYISYTFKGFTLGTWASYAFTDDASQEVDLYLSYNYQLFTFTLNDYFYVLDQFGNYNDYFDWDKTTSSHYLEGIFEFSGFDKVPVRFLAGIMLLGGDIDANNDRQFSTYFELAYDFKIKNVDTEVFVGFTPFSGFYSDGFDFTNVGLKASKDINITEKFSIPFSGSFIMNPAAKTVMFLATVSF